MEHTEQRSELAAAPPEVASKSAGRRARRGPLSVSTYVAIFTVIALAAGAVSGWIWRSLVTTPSYLTSDDGSVQITERAQGQIFAADAVFVVLGMIVGLGLGFAAWQFLRRVGWPVALIAVGGGILAAATCWLVGVLQGPRNFPARVAEAMPGDQVPIDFELHTTSAVLVWALGAIIPVMLYANLSREDEPVESRSGKVREAGPDQAGQISSGDLH